MVLFGLQVYMQDSEFFLKKYLHQRKLILYICTHKCGSSSVGRAPAFQAGCREFEPRLPL
jgi:hypothetical protein